MKVHLIWAQDENGGIGIQGKLPWRLPEDMKNFKRLTTGYPVIMGRLTWDSLPIKPLPNRRNIVFSTRKMKEVESYSHIRTCFDRLKKDQIDTIFIIGGARIYYLFFPIATDLHISIVTLTVPGIDTMIPIAKNTIIREFDLKETMELSERVKYYHWARKTKTIPS